MLPEAPDTTDLLTKESYLGSEAIRPFLETYYAHHRFVCAPRFNRTPTSGSGVVHVDTQYPDLNAGLVLPARKCVVDSKFLSLLDVYKALIPVDVILALASFAIGPVAGIVGLVVGLVVFLCIRQSYCNRIKELFHDLAVAQTPLSPEARVVLEKLIECFDSEQPGIPPAVKTVYDATLYLSNLRTALYRRIQEQESAARVKLAQIQAAADVAYAR